MIATFRGKVIHGDGKGKGLGFPTANLDTPRAAISLGEGVYAAFAVLKEKKYQAALSIREKPWKVEVYLFDFDGHDIYGEELPVEVLDFISPMEAVSSQAQLIEKIQKDIEKIKTYLQNKSPS